MKLKYVNKHQTLKTKVGINSLITYKLVGIYE